MQNPWTLTDTIQLLPVVDHIQQPASYLTDTFFSNVLPPVNSSYVAVEFRKQGRVLAPYVVEGGRGQNVSRVASQVRLYRAPLVAPRRVIGLRDIELRQFGEIPCFSSITPADRFAQMQVDDLSELLRMVQKRKNQQAAEILQTGKATVKGFADDGRTVVEDEIDFQWDGAVDASTDWSNANADIYGDIKAVSERIQENSGTIPTLMICGKNVARKMLNNTEIFKWLQVPNRDSLFMASFNPQYITPQVQAIGQITALNLTVVSYSETFTDDDGTTKNFVDPDKAIIGVPNSGKQLYGAVTYLDNSGEFQTVAAPHVPVYRFDTDAQQTSLTLFSRFLMCPNEISDFCCINTKL